MEKAEGVQVYLSRSDKTNVAFENDMLKSVTFSQDTDLHVKVIHGGRIGSSRTTDAGDIDGVVQRALETAEFGSPARFEFPPFSEGQDVPVYDEKVLSLTPEAIVEKGRDMLKTVKEYNSDILVDAEGSASRSSIEFANSSGMKYSADKTGFSMYISGQLVRGTDILFAGDWFGWRRHEIDHEKLAENTVQYFTWAEENTEIGSGDIPVIFTPQGMSVLVLALQLGLNGKNVFMGSSPLSDKKGEKIADERFSIADDPMVAYAPGSASFDGEGMPRQRLPLIQDGVVSNFIYDLDTAARAGTGSTGHGPGCEFTNMVIGEGDCSFEDMIANTDKGLLVHSVLGLGQGNPISGEFSVNMQLGYVIRNGKIAGRAKNIMLAGNTYEVLNRIDCIGDTAEWTPGGLLTPPVKIEHLSVVAK
jgi:PmbA protein